MKATVVDALATMGVAPDEAADQAPTDDAAAAAFERLGAASTMKILIAPNGP